MKQLVRHNVPITSHRKHDSGHVSDLPPEGKGCRGFGGLPKPSSALVASLRPPNTAPPSGSQADSRL